MAELVIQKKDPVTQLKQAIAAAEQGPTTHGAKNLQYEESDHIYLDGMLIEDLAIDNVRLIDGSPYLRECTVERMRVARTDMDRLEIAGGRLTNVSFKDTNLFMAEIAGCGIYGLTFEGGSWGAHIWDRAVVPQHMILPTNWDGNLPEGKRFVRSPYMARQFEEVMFRHNCGEDVRFDGLIAVGKKSMILGNMIRNFTLSNGVLSGVSFNENLLHNAVFSATTIERGSFSKNILIDATIKNCVFRDVGMERSVVAMTPELLTSRFFGCDIGVPERSPVFLYNNRAVVGVVANAKTGFLEPDLSIEASYRNPTPDMIRESETHTRWVAATLQGLRDNPGKYAIEDFTRSLNPVALDPMPFSEIYPALVAQVAQPLPPERLGLQLRLSSPSRT